MTNARHRVRTEHVTAVRERIERVLGVTTTAEVWNGQWFVLFAAPEDVDLDFLRPDVLPPKIRPNA